MDQPKFQIERVQGAPVSSEDILADMQRVAKLAGHTVMPNEERF
jgi:hypothetical protein